ncbi:fungal hydrophobin, partial [Punctularia strigosozonata HHB-11173 SS5]
PAASATSVTVSQCNTSSIQCCNSVQSSSSQSSDLLLGLLGIVLDTVDGLIGIGCSPISVLGLGNGGCNASPVCCENNSFGGLISIGCVVIQL